MKQSGWRALDTAYRASMKNVETDKEAEDKALPELTEGQELPVTGAAVKEGKTTPPKHFSEDTLLAAMETAGAKDMPRMPNVKAGHPRHPCRDFGEAGVHRLSGTEKE